MNIVCDNKLFPVEGILSTSGLINDIINNCDKVSIELNIDSKFINSLGEINNKIISYDSFNFIYSNLKYFDIMLEDKLITQELFNEIMDKLDESVNSEIRRLELFNFLNINLDDLSKSIGKNWK